MADEVIFDTEEKLTSLFQPDMLLCHQYFATCCTKRLEPEKSLMLAVLQTLWPASKDMCFRETVGNGPCSMKPRIGSAMKIATIYFPLRTSAKF